MKSYQEFLTEAEKDRGSSKTKAIVDVVDSLKNVLNKYDISTRHSVWEHLNSPKGKELMNKILRNPKTYLSDSEFVKLVEKK